MSRPDDYLASLAFARKQAALATDSDIKATWERIASGWADLARQRGQLEQVDLPAEARIEPGPQEQP